MRLDQVVIKVATEMPTASMSPGLEMERIFRQRGSMVRPVDGMDGEIMRAMTAAMNRETSRRKKVAGRNRVMKCWDLVDWKKNHPFRNAKG